VNGKRIRRAAGSTPEEAEVLAAEILAEETPPEARPVATNGGPSEQSHRSMGNARFLIRIGDGFELFPSRNVIRIRGSFPAADLA
jgi:hypothetical protein